jgi:DNA polymerase-4
MDMDAFYAAVEIRDNPALAGKPLIIGYPGPRGVVSTCSYEARRFGVHSAMPSVTAMRLCPQATWLPGRMGLYSEVSRRILAMLDDVSPAVEPLSIDEAFIDLTGIAADLAQGREAGARLKERIRREERLTASVGVAPNKFLAKVASDLEKPDGLVVFPLEDVPRRLWPLPVERLWGVGPKTAAHLRSRAIQTVGDLLETPERDLVPLLGEGLSHHLLSLARGEDDRRVESEREAKSISEERTYERDLTDKEAIDRALLARGVGVARQLRRQKLAARTVHLKVRAGDFTTWTRSKTLTQPTDLAGPIVAAAREMLASKIPLGRRGVRLLGVGVSGLARAGLAQAELFEDAGAERTRRLARAADLVRERFGDEAVTRARLTRGRGKKDGAGEASSLPSVD